MVVAVLLFVPAGWHEDQFIYSSSSVSRALLMAESAATQVPANQKSTSRSHAHASVCVLQSKALRERWLLDGAPAEEETQRRLHEDEVKTKLLEQVILRSASEIRTGVKPVTNLRAA